MLVVLVRDSNMAFSEKDATPAYSPIQDDLSSDSARESDELLDGGYRPVTPYRTSRKGQLLTIVGVVVALIAYSILITTATSMWWKRQRIHGANVVNSMP